MDAAFVLAFCHRLDYFGGEEGYGMQALFIVLAIAAVCLLCRYILLFFERQRLRPVGRRLEVDGHYMNVYTEGAEKDSVSTIVFLSGSGTPSPVYDFKVLYSKLSDQFRVAVVEKFGYGYADISGLPRDVETMVREDREALIKAGVEPPYLLMPHSMSALEAIWWAAKYPEEVEAIIGLDMAVPGSYDRARSNLGEITLKRFMVFLGAHRLPFLNKIEAFGLTEAEAGQNRLLTYCMTLNKDVYEECRRVYDNADAVRALGSPDVPMLLFTTTLGDRSKNEKWVAAQKEFCESAGNCRQILLDCGHYLHYSHSEYIAEQIKLFLRDLHSPSAD